MRELLTILDIISVFMGLDEDHCYCGNQNWIIPKDGRLTVVGTPGAVMIFANNSFFESRENLEEIITTRERKNIILDIFSYDQEAVERKEEILFALKCVEAENRMARAGFSIASIPNSFTFVPERSGNKILNRFNINILASCGRKYRTEAAAIDGNNISIFNN
jgi:hypothetical protein